MEADKYVGCDSISDGRLVGGESCSMNWQVSEKELVESPRMQLDSYPRSNLLDQSG